MLVDETDAVCGSHGSWSSTVRDWMNKVRRCVRWRTEGLEREEENIDRRITCPRLLGAIVNRPSNIPDENRPDDPAAPFRVLGDN